MSISTAASFIAALRDQLDARLTDVTVHLVPPADVSLADSIVLVRDRITGTQERALLGRRLNNDAYRIPGAAEAYVTDVDGSDAFEAAITRAAEIVGEVAEELRDNPPDVGDQTRIATVDEIAYQPLIGEKGGWVCRAEFAISYEARVS